LNAWVRDDDTIDVHLTTGAPGRPDTLTVYRDGVHNAT
jgi:hypothetical protein